MIFKSIKTGGIPRVLIAILGGPGVYRPVLQVLTHPAISDQKMSLSAPFQNLACKKLCHHNW